MMLTAITDRNTVFAETVVDGTQDSQRDREEHADRRQQEKKRDTFKRIAERYNESAENDRRKRDSEQEQVEGHCPVDPRAQLPLSVFTLRVRPGGLAHRRNAHRLAGEAGVSNGAHAG